MHERIQVIIQINWVEDSKKHTKPKKQVNIDIEEKADADMGQPLDSGHTEIDGTGDSEVSEWTSLCRTRYS